MILDRMYSSEYILFLHRKFLKDGGTREAVLYEEAERKSSKKISHFQHSFSMKMSDLPVIINKKQSVCADGGRICRSGRGGRRFL